jgi:hypothetical protein
MMSSRIYGIMFIHERSFWIDYPQFQPCKSWLVVKTILSNSPHIQISARGIVWVSLEKGRYNTIVEEKGKETIIDVKQNLKTTKKNPCWIEKQRKKHNIAYIYVTDNDTKFVSGKELMFCRYVNVRELCIRELLFWVNTTLKHINMRTFPLRYEDSNLIHRP